MQRMDIMFNNSCFLGYNILSYLKKKEQASSICSNLSAPHSPPWLPKAHTWQAWLAPAGNRYAWRHNSLKVANFTPHHFEWRFSLTWLLYCLSFKSNFMCKRRRKENRSCHVSRHMLRLHQGVVSIFLWSSSFSEQNESVLYTVCRVFHKCRITLGGQFPDMIPTGSSVSQYMSIKNLSCAWHCARGYGEL